ncbi:MAG: hypothetical protein EBT63_01575 [Proteobacteria bacterium]|nr:hypothetical protein [Pseudomonadota bacterium]NCA28174.1 hypothetical protein [Pseudomonadota bacterium]
MVYIIISNIGLAIMMIYIYFRYTHFRINSAKEIKELRAKSDSQSVELRNFDAKLLSSVKSYQDRVEALLIEIGKVRQEKEKEIELRSEIEKKFEILNQKNTDYEVVHNEITNAIMNIVNDTHETAKNLGKDLYEKITTNYKKESLENQKLMAKINQNVAEFVAKFNSSQLSSAQSYAPKKKDEVDFAELFLTTQSEVAKNAVIDAIDLIKNKGLSLGKEFFTSQSFDESKSKFLLSEIALVKNQTLYLLDFKATNHIFEYYANKSRDDKSADENFANKFKRYLVLLSNNKYYEIINSLLESLGLNYKSHKISIIVPSRSEIRLLKELQFFDKAQQLGIDVKNIDEIEKTL